MNSNRKVAVVTGAGRGIGKAVAQALAEDMVDLVLAEIEGDRARAAAMELGRVGVATLVHVTDVSNRASVEGLIAATIERFGRLDILVNNAGITEPSPALDMTEEQWDHVLAVDLKGVFLCSQAAGRHMVTCRSGSIINIASIGAERGILERANSCAAKAGVVALTRVLAVEWAPFGVRVNAVGPGYVNTELQQWAIDQGIADLESRTRTTPLGRLAEPSEMGHVVAFLASDQASYITGQTIYADGGLLAAAPR
jgi:NAD(P)-dependent dehydrogenase (short-subunit alcohol dehydrogenase family)